MDVIALVEPCTYPVDFDHDEDGYYPSDYCGKPAVDDEDEPRCAEHLEDWGREGMPEFNGAFG